MTARHYNFGTGNLYATPFGGINPIPFAALQDVSVNFSGDVKQLFGQNQFALATARGKVKIEGKAKAGQIDLNLYNSLFFGETVTAGMSQASFNEAQSVPAASPYTVTVANGATFAENLSVYYANTGLKLTQVSASPTAGQYTVNATTGVYTFSVGDAGAALLFNYLYTSATGGFTLAGNNLLMGNIPQFRVDLANYNQQASKWLTLTLFCCVSSKLDFAFKQEDFLVPELDFMAQDNGAGQVFSFGATMG